MTIAVTGASGFVGRHVLQELASHTMKIVAVTRKPARFSDLRNRIEIVEMDISDFPEDCFTKLSSPNVLIHLAWDGLPNYKSLHHFETELPRQYRFLKAMVEGGLPSLLVTGTCFEYGMQAGPLSEDLAPLPSNPYGYAKDALRRQLEWLQKAHPFILTWARLFYMYGEGQPESSLYPQLKEAVLRGEPKFNMSGGEQLRDYLPVSEVAKIILHLAIHQSDTAIINVCAGSPISVRRLVEQWLVENGWHIALNLGHYPYPDYEPMAFWGDRHRLNTILENS